MGLGLHKRRRIPVGRIIVGFSEGLCPREVSSVTHYKLIILCETLWRPSKLFVLICTGSAYRLILCTIFCVCFHRLSAQSFRVKVMMYKWQNISTSSVYNAHTVCTVLRFGGHGVTKRGCNENLQKYSLLISLYLSFRLLLRMQELATRCTDFRGVC